MIPAESDRRGISDLQKSDKSYCDICTAVYHCGDPYQADRAADGGGLNGASNKYGAAT